MPIFIYFCSMSLKNGPELVSGIKCKRYEKCGHPCAKTEIRNIFDVSVLINLFPLLPVPPTPARLKPLDIEFMKRLHEKVNIIPLIAKADTLTPEECQQFKKQVSGCACSRRLPRQPSLWVSWCVCAVCMQYQLSRGRVSRSAL